MTCSGLDIIIINNIQITHNNKLPLNNFATTSTDGRVDFLDHTGQRTAPAALPALPEHPER